MSKRPVCLVVLLFVAALMLSIYTGTQDKRSPVWSDGELHELQGLVTDKQWKQTKGGMQLTLYVESDEGTVLCVLKDLSQEPYMGQRVRVSGQVVNFAGATNPGEFDAGEYYQISNISYKLKSASILEASKQFSKTKEILYRIKLFLGHMLEQMFDEDSAAILKTMLLGDKSTLDGDLKNLYQLSGIVHILAISGLHISMLGMAFYKLLSMCYLPQWICVSASVSFLLAYGQMAGMGNSVVRAIGMYSIYLGAKLLGRTYDMLTALAITAFWMLCEQPLLVRNSGFLLSYGAVLSISLIVPWWKSLWQEKKSAGRNRLKKVYDKYIRDPFLAGTGIGLGTLPILLFYYNRYPVYALLLNLLVIPLMPILVVDGLLAVGVGAWQIRLGRFIGIPGRIILECYSRLCRISLQLPGGNLNLGHRAPWRILLYYAGLAGILIYHYVFSKKQKKAHRAMQFVLMTVLLLLLTAPQKHGAEVTFLDVGQGDCILVRDAEGDCYMVDGGSSSKSDVATYQIIPYLRYKGINRLEAVFVTHPDSDHISGILELLDTQAGMPEIRRLILPDVEASVKEQAFAELLQLAAERETEVLYMSQGQQIQGHDIHFLSLGPVKGLYASELNEISQVLQISIGDMQFLLTGDVTGMPEKEASAYYAGQSGAGACRVLKVAHHGSKYSTDEIVLDDYMPDFAIISSGYGNRYGHPHRELLKRLYDRGITVLRTDRCGAITFEITDGKMRIKTGAKEKILKNP